MHIVRKHSKEPTKNQVLFAKKWRSATPRRCPRVNNILLSNSSCVFPTVTCKRCLYFSIWGPQNLSNKRSDKRYVYFLVQEAIQCSNTRGQFVFFKKMCEKMSKTILKLNSPCWITNELNGLGHRLIRDEKHAM